MEFGIALTGIHWVGESLPRVNYELIWEAKKESGTDFFASATFFHLNPRRNFKVGASLHISTP